MGTGSLMGLVIGAAVCGVLAAVGIVVSKKDKVRIDDYLNTMSDEEKNLVQNQTFTATEKKNMFTSNAFVVKSETVEGKVEAVLIFYMENHKAFYDRKVKLDVNDPKAKTLVRGAFVPVSMKWDKDMYYYDYKGLI